MIRPKNLPRESNERAVTIARILTGDEQPDSKTKNRNAVALGRRGGLKGGKARAAKLTPEQRREAARKAARARWPKKRLTSSVT